MGLFDGRIIKAFIYVSITFVIAVIINSVDIKARVLAVRKNDA